MVASASAPRNRLWRKQVVILTLLLLLAGVAWVLLLLWPDSMQTSAMGSANSMGTMDSSRGARLTAGMRAPLFLAMWTVMMIAMMFPAAAPMILTFARIQGDKRDRGQVFVPTWVFAGGYLLAWVATGALAFLLASGADRLAARSALLSDNAARTGGLVLLLAGVYQFTPYKYSCLTKCRTPLQFIMTSWRDGVRGALRMGIEHGAYCVGCCWLLFVILFPLGVMNIAAMAFITAVVFAEKLLPLGRQVTRLAAVALIAYGLLVMLHPAALPTTM